MPPTLPAPNLALESQVIRDQLQALFNLINNIHPLTAAQIDGVTTSPPGEVSNNDLNAAIDGTSSISNGVSTLDSGMGNLDAEELRVKLNELINALRR